MPVQLAPAPHASPSPVAGPLIEALADVDLPGMALPQVGVELHEAFLKFGYVRLAGFLAGDILETFTTEMARLEGIAVRRRFVMPGFQTPRRLSVLGGSAIRDESPTLHALYHHHTIRACIERIAGRRLYSCRHPEEFMVANFLQHAGDTHGWHLDDPPLALVIFAHAPCEGEGGEVEMIGNWPELCRRRAHAPDRDVTDLVAWAEDNDFVDRYRHRAGDAYLLRADVNLHRVVPLASETARRWVLNLAFETARDVRYGETANLLYSGTSRRDEPAR